MSAFRAPGAAGAPPDDQTAPDPVEREERVRSAQTRFSASLPVTVGKIILLGLIDAMLVFAMLAAATEEAWPVLAAVIAITIALNVIYLPANRMLPGKYLFPGLVFMLVFSVSVMLYTVYISFTNYGDGHNSTRQDAITAIVRNNQVRVEDSPIYNAGVGERDGDLWLVIRDPETEEARAGSNEQPLEAVSSVQVSSTGAVTAAEGFRMLSFAELSQRSAEIQALAVPISDDPNDGFLHTTTGSQAFLYRSTVVYDETAGTMTNAQGKVYRDVGTGSFTADDGTTIEPGWRINVGLSNYTSALTNTDIRQPFLRVLAWTFAFSILSVLITFALGLFLAMTFNVRIRGQRLYRVLMVLPYAFPATMMTMVWAGMMNRDFGFINQVIFRGADIAWLTDPTLAKVALLTVNLWLGFPYQFLVCSGALQSIPEEAIEAAAVDGASPWQTFRSIKLPLLMISLAPLLISSFAFNFNNFNLVFLLTRGGPRFLDTTLDVGASDILISMVYKVAFGDAVRQYGLGSAFAILIFIIVGLVSWIGFRQTRALEDIN